MKIFYFICSFLIFYFFYSFFSSNSIGKNRIRANDLILIIGTSDDYPPYTFTKDGITQGFDIDLCNLIAKKLNKKIKLKTMSFDVLLLELDKGNVDIVAAGISPNVQRAKKVEFTNSYLSGDPLIVISKQDKNEIENVEDLFNKKVVVNEGYTADFYLSKFQKINIFRVETVAEGLLSINSNRSDFYVCAQSALDLFLNKNKQHPFRVSILSDVKEEYALALSKNNIKLFQLVNSALIELINEGEVLKLKNKWEIK